MFWCFHAIAIAATEGSRIWQGYILQNSNIGLMSLAKINIYQMASQVVKRNCLKINLWNYKNFKKESFFPPLLEVLKRPVFFSFIIMHQNS